jgi:hypothetical protein
MNFRRIQLVPVVAVLAGLTIGPSTTANAQDIFGRPAAAVETVGAGRPDLPATRVSIRDWPSAGRDILAVRGATRSSLGTLRASQTRPPRPPSRYTAAQRVMTVVGLSLAGFIVGGKLGSTLPCDCYDEDGPMLQGIIGGFAGAGAGAVLGVMLTR